VTAKTLQLQIRVAPAQKAALRRAARAAGLGVSEYVLARALPQEASRFAALLGILNDPEGRPFAFAELNDLLAGCVPVEFPALVAGAPAAALDAYTRNYVAALVEQAAAQKGVAPPAWTGDVAPLDEPHFAADLPGLRLHLLRAAPAVFKRRNLFVDAGLGARV
jgi:hypothetical protein